MKKTGIAFILLGFFLLGRSLAETPSAPTRVSTPDSVAKGQAVYLQKCFFCHGEKGDGQGPAAGILNPKPRDFTREELKYGASDEAIFETIANGVPGTPMAPFGRQLSEEEIWQLVHFLKSLRAK